MARPENRDGQEVDYSALSEESLNRVLRDSHRDATIYERRFRGSDPITPDQMKDGEGAKYARKAAFMEVLRRDAAGTLETITIRPHIEVILPPIPGDTNRDFQGRVDLDSRDLGEGAFNLTVPTEG